MPIYHRTYSPGELRFITTSTYRRTPVFLSPRFCHYFVQRLEEVRQKMNCLLIGWVLMPEHFHLLLKPQPAESTPLVLDGHIPQRLSTVGRRLIKEALARSPKSNRPVAARATTGRKFSLLPT